MVYKRLLSKVAFLLVGLFLEVCCSWSLLSNKSSLSSPRALVVAVSGDDDRVEQARTLLQHLKQGKSLFHPGITVVSVGHGDECGIQLQLQQPRQQKHQRGEPPSRLPTGANVIFLDRADFITPQSGLETSVGRALQWHLSQKGNAAHLYFDKLPCIYLAIYLTLFKQGLLVLEPNSVIADYLKTLPSSLEHLPVFWQDYMLEELQCSTLKQAVETRRRDWENEFKLIQMALHEVGLTRLLVAWSSLDTWYWARSIITTRAFTDFSNNDQPCLCPYVDMMNHITALQSKDNGEVVHCTWNIDWKGFHLQIPQRDGCGDDHTSILEISYGKHSNAKFLINYGFSISNDPETAKEGLALIPVRLPNSVQDQETITLWEADGLGDCHSIARNVTVGIGTVGPMESVLSLCRVASAQQCELSCMKEIFLDQVERSDQ